MTKLAITLAIAALTLSAAETKTPEPPKAEAAKAETPKVPLITIEQKLKWFKVVAAMEAAQVDARDAQARIEKFSPQVEKTRAELNSSCGKDFVLSYDQAGDPACAEKPKAADAKAKAETDKAPEK